MESDPIDVPLQSDEPIIQPDGSLLWPSGVVSRGLPPQELIVGEPLEESPFTRAQREATQFRIQAIMAAQDDPPGPPGGVGPDDLVLMATGIPSLLKGIGALSTRLFATEAETLAPRAATMFTREMEIGNTSAKLSFDSSLNIVGNNVTAESGAAALGGKLYPPEKLQQLVPYLEKRGISVYGTEGNPRFTARADGTGIMELPANPTVLQVKHELSHYLDSKNLGFEAYRDLGRPARESLVLERLQSNRIWNQLNEAERNFSNNYVERLRNGQ